MESATGGETNGYSIQWKIENLSHCWLETGQKISSPAFIADALEGTKWLLFLYPKGRIDENKVDFYLCRENNCTGPEHFQVNYRLSFLDKDGSPSNMVSQSEEMYCKGYMSCRAACIPRETLIVTERGTFISKDTLTVQCDIWKSGETPVTLRHLSARTVLKVNRRSFLWKINEFSTLKPGARTKFKDDLIDFDLVLNEGLDFERKLFINGTLIDESIKYFSFTTCIINSVGRKEDCGTHEYFACDLRRGISSTLLFIEKLKENENRYLPNDVLTLGCEYVCSNGAVSYQFCGQGIISPEITNVRNKKGNECCTAKEETAHTPGLVNDMKSMFTDGIFSDAEIRTSTQSFKVHRNILSTRSLVFKKMFDIDMNEKKFGHVDITDFEEDTIHRMLLYVYTDSLEDLQLENAVILYEVADKYEILSLKSRCSSFLKDNLCPNKACDILVVADLHLDDDLKSAVQDYMLEHEEIFSSQEWKHIMNINLKLAAETMHRKFLPG